MPFLKLDRKAQSLLAILIGLIIIIVANKATSDDPNNDLKTVVSYIGFIFALISIVVGLKVLLKK